MNRHLLKIRAFYKKSSRGYFVIPAKAGNQCHRPCRLFWTPAVAGVTALCKRPILLLLVVMAITLAATEGLARAESARTLVDRGNSLYAAGKFDEAKKVYEEAAVKAPDSPEIQYDLGNARYKLNDLAGAAEAYQQATAKGRSRDLIGRSEFNLGNTAFRQGEVAEAKDPEAAINSFQESIGHFRAALDLNGGGKGAGRNLEVSKRRLLTVREELKKRQEAQENERRKQEEMAKELKQMADQQQAMADKSREQAGKQGAADKEAMAGQAGEQQKMKESTDSLHRKMGQTPAQEKAGKELDQAEQHQQEAVDKLNENRPDEAAKAQDQATEALRQAAEHLQGKEDKPVTGGQEAQTKKEEPRTARQSAPPQEGAEKNAQSGTQQSKKTQGKGLEDKGAGVVDAPPVDQTAQELLNEEKQNAIQRQQQLSSGAEAVDKDW